mmetsp:Transcript_144985/g.450105  ORF Transcript_144985/g.450105 Transcript_144985/m.450105 type:complete len:200 (-) Transcript_144985:130-729(-)
MDVERRDWALYPQDAYDSQQARLRPAKDDPPALRRKRKYESEGMRRTVRAALLVHRHGHPHVLALRGAQGRYELPGGTLRPGESEREGLNRKMKRLVFNADPASVCEWRVGDLLAVWWCPSFEGAAYPYLPQHVTRPKECIRVYQVLLPAQCVFAVPQNENLVAVPFFDLFDDPQAYGRLLAEVPQLLSKYALSINDAT